MNDFALQQLIIHTEIYYNRACRCAKGGRPAKLVQLSPDIAVELSGLLQGGDRLLLNAQVPEASTSAVPAAEPRHFADAGHCCSTAGRQAAARKGSKMAKADRQALVKSLSAQPTLSADNTHPATVDTLMKVDTSTAAMVPAMPSSMLLGLQWAIGQPLADARWSDARFDVACGNEAALLKSPGCCSEGGVFASQAPLQSNSQQLVQSFGGRLSDEELEGVVYYGPSITFLLPQDMGGALGHAVRCHLVANGRLTLRQLVSLVSDFYHEQVRHVEDTLVVMPNTG